VEHGEKIVVGVNRFQQANGESLTALRIDSSVERGQVERLRQVRASRDKNEVEARLGALEDAARGSDNLMPKILTACESFATIGEMSDRLRKVFGEYREA